MSSNKIFNCYLLLMLLLSLCSCTNKKETSETKTYQYKYMASTDICNNICYNNKIVPINFHPKSDKKKLNLLNSLDPNILYPSSDRIFLIGNLYNEVKKTPYGKNRPTVEKYQEFELIHWYILTPFKKNAGELPDEYKLLESKRLEPKDIGIGPIGKLFIDINDYQKQE